MKVREDTKCSIRSMIQSSSSLELELVWLPKIMENQTYNELKKCRTILDNGVGLSGADSTAVTIIYNRVKSGEHLTDSQVIYLKKVLSKYWRQYANKMEVNNE